MKRNRVIKGIITLLLTVSTLGVTTSVYAANNMAFSAGGNSGDGVNMTNCTLANYTWYKNMGYNSNYATSNATYETLSGKFSNGTKRLESDIVVLAGHGASDHIVTLENSAGKHGLIVKNKAGKYAGANSFDWSKVKLAIFLGCETGKETSYDYINLAYYIFARSNWKTTSMGWRQKIDSGAAEKWIDNFNNKLNTRANVRAALNYANSKSYGDQRVKDLAFYGNGDLVLKKSSKSVTKNVEDKIDESNITYVKDNIKFNGKEDLSNIEKLLQKKNEQFKLKDYQVDIYTHSKENGYYTIELTYKINGIKTNSSYTVIVYNGKVEQIADNSIATNNIDSRKLNISDERQKTDIAKFLAKTNLIINNINENLTLDGNINTIEIKKQSTEKIFDINKNKTYIRIYTEYGYKGDNASAVTCYDYEI